jgi:hypothetical protein
MPINHNSRKDEDDRKESEILRLFLFFFSLEEFEKLTQ